MIKTMLFMRKAEQNMAIECIVRGSRGLVGERDGRVNPGSWKTLEKTRRADGTFLDGRCRHLRTTAAQR